MENRLTKALGCGDIPSVAEYERVTNKILTDNFLFKKVIEALIWEHGPGIIANLRRPEIEAFQKRIDFVRKTPQIRIVWEFLPEFRVPSGTQPMLRCRRFHGDSKTHEEQMFWRVNQQTPIEEFAKYEEPWTRTLVSSDAVIEFSNWKNQPNTEGAREIAMNEAEKAQQKQNKLTGGEVGAAVTTQQGKSGGTFLIDNSKLHKDADPAHMRDPITGAL